ncbi:acyl carrier protein [Streptosporangium sp. CA-135522]|uniref:acyl carrier protein n=1 Tax=Streptosporangium sp. CA-135522 TaxID=3240072 RepID=UPI003D8BEEE7
MTTSQESVVDTVRRIIDQQLNFSVHGHELGSDDDLWSLGMTSLTCLGLMLSIEDTFEIELPEESLTGSTFRSVNTITAAVEDARHRGHRSLAAEGLSRQT